MTAHAPLRSRLRSIEPDHAARQTRLLAALQHRRVGELHLTVAVAEAAGATAWIGCDTAAGTIWLAPLLVDGTLARTGGGTPDAAALAATLEPLEPLVAALEQVLARELLPRTVAREPGATAALTLRIDAAAGDGTIRHRLLLALPDGVAADGAPLPPAGTFPLGEAQPLGIRLLGPTVPASRFATVANGDLMLLGSAPLLVQTTATGSSTRRATLDLKGGSLTLQDLAEEPAVAPASGTALRVATTIELDGCSLTAAEAGALAEGSVLALPVTGGTLTARVVSGDTLIGEGELVALGDGFGLLFTRVALSPAIAADPA